jgi:hypothetical protein
VGFLDFFKSSTATDIVGAEILFYPGRKNNLTGMYGTDSKVSVRWSYPPRPVNAPDFPNEFFRIYLSALYWGNMLVVSKGDNVVRDPLRSNTVQAARSYLNNIKFWAPNMGGWVYAGPQDTPAKKTFTATLFTQDLRLMNRYKLAFGEEQEFIPTSVGALLFSNFKDLSPAWVEFMARSILYMEEYYQNTGKPFEFAAYLHAGSYAYDKMQDTLRELSKQTG